MTSLPSSSSIRARAEVQRVRRHIAEAEAMMWARDLTGLSVDQRTIRRFLLEELSRYRARGVFPKNHVSAELTPQFVDDHGVRCAMAHLLEVTGFGHVVERIRRTKNDVRIRELANDPELLAWLVAVGMTLDEAARVQPSYCFLPKGGCLCNLAGAEAVIEGSVVAGSPPYVRVDVVHGTTSQVSVGDHIELSRAYPEGSVGDAMLGKVQKVVGEAGVDSGPPSISLVLESRALRCDSVSASKEDVIEAWLAEDCMESLKAKNPMYAEPSCKDDDGFGCHASPHGSSNAFGNMLGVVLVFAAALGTRRVVHRLS